MRRKPLYFDNHATTPVDPRVLEAMLPYFTEAFGNAESVQHAYGWQAKTAVDRARQQTAALLGADPSEIVFTSGATESIHFAVLGLLELQEPGRHIITANAEHKATLEVCERARKHGHDVTVLPVDPFGQVSADQVRQAIRPNTALVTLLHGNNEIGTLNPIEEIGAVCAEHGVVFHVDAAQSAGKHIIDVHACNISLLSISGHKFYAPKGIGALYIRRKAEPRIHLEPLFVGGGQERGLRAGTPNVPGIVGLGHACEIANQELITENARLQRLRDRIIGTALEEIGDCVLNGHPTERLCNNVNLTLLGVQPDDLLLGLKGIAYSSASACAGGSVSHVLKAIGQVSDDPFTATVRFGLGRFTQDEDVETLIRELTVAIRNARSISNSYKPK